MWKLFKMSNKDFGRPVMMISPHRRDLESNLKIPS